MVTLSHIILFIQLLVFTCNTNAYREVWCPKHCFCHFDHEEYNLEYDFITDCSSRNFTSMVNVYEELNKNNFILNMSANYLKKIDLFPTGLRLQKLFLSRNYINKIQRTTFIRMDDLNEIDLSYNLIEYVDPFAFADIAVFKILNLEGNPLNEVSGPFLYARTLTHLYLANCHLTTLSPQFFVDMENIAELDLSGNNLQYLEPFTFNSLRYLINLNLNNCNLTQLNGVEFNNLYNLVSIKLAGNNFVSDIEWNLVMSYFPNLMNLDLRKSGVSHLPENTFSNNLKLNTLILAENKLFDLDVAITIGRTLLYLEYLDLSYCYLQRSFSEATFINTIKLHTLVLSGNQLYPKNLALAISPLFNLTSLSLRDCGLTMLPENTLNKFTKLQKLDIARNPLNDVNTELKLSALKQLEYLDVSYTNLQKISNITFSKMFDLKTLILSGNKLTTLEAGLFQNLMKLKLLELNNCDLVELNSRVFRHKVLYHDLQELRLSGNPLKIPKVGSILPVELFNIITLDLSKCNITFLPDDSFRTTPLIEILLLNGNKFKGDKENSMNFLELVNNLNELDLRFNEMTFIKPDKLIYSHQLHSVKLIGNPWICNCFIIDMIKWANLFKRSLDILDNFSVAANLNNELSEYLTCNIDLQTTPIKTNHLLWKLKLFPSNLQYTWEWYSQDANCSSNIFD